MKSSASPARVSPVPNAAGGSTWPCRSIPRPIREDGSRWRWSCGCLTAYHRRRRRPRLTTLFEEFVAAVPARSRLRGQRVELTPVATGLGGIREQYLQPAQIASAILGAVLLLACANWATLLLARASARRRELTIRVALGSSRFRISRQLFVECVSLALAGGALGFAAAVWGVALSAGQWSAAGLHIVPDVRVLLFAAAVTFGTGVLFALAPVWLIGGIRAGDLESLTSVGRGARYHRGPKPGRRAGRALAGARRRGCVLRGDAAQSARSGHGFCRRRRRHVYARRRRDRPRRRAPDGRAPSAARAFARAARRAERDARQRDAAEQQ